MEFVFGKSPKFKVTVTDDSIFIDNREIQVSDIQKIFVTQPTALTNGQIYFSPDGTKPKGLLAAGLRTVFYTKDQKDDVTTLLSLFTVEVEGVEKVIEKAPPKPKKDKNAITCPKCGSATVTFMKNDKKGFSVGKAVGGGLLTGGIGALAGFAGKKGKEDLWHCNQCGHTFSAKAR